MGEEFVGKRNEGTCRRRDKKKAELYEKNLFAGCAPEQITSVMGMTSDGSSVAPGDRIWADRITPSGPIPFYAGNQLAVEVKGSGADFLRTQYAGCSGPIVAEVRSRAAASGIVQIQARTMG